MARFIVSIINNERSFFFIILFFMGMVIIFSGLYHYVLPSPAQPALMHSLNKQTPITYLDSFYFSATTQTTVGYGDIVAVSRPAKIVALAQCMFGYFYLAFSAAIFACRGIIRSKKFELLLHGYKRLLNGADEYNN
jgi:hypothetical protein